MLALAARVAQLAKEQLLGGARWLLPLAGLARQSGRL
jgi:hypothetical protein